MLFLGIISWKGALNFNGGLFFRWEASFLSGGCAPLGETSVLMGGGGGGFDKKGG